MDDRAKQNRIVILEKDHRRRDYLRSIINAWGHTPFLFERVSRCLDNISALKPDLVISGTLQADKTFRFVNSLKTSGNSLPVIIISDSQEIVDYIESNDFGDVSLIDERLDLEEMRGVLNRALRNDLQTKPAWNCPLIVGSSPDMKKIKRLIPELNRMEETALIQGEAGTGKDLLARVIHRKSERCENPFVKLNVRELSYTRLNGSMGNDIAGIERRVENDPAEVFELANRGTLFLDEIETMRAGFQARLLRFFELGSIHNSDRENMDVRILAATSNGLQDLVNKGEFRKDLFYRLNVCRIELPPLRRRREDIAQLTDFFTDRFCRELDKSHYELSTKTKEIFLRYRWPGNVRELENMVRSIVLQEDEESMADKLHLLSENERLLNSPEGPFPETEIEKLKKYIENADSWSLKEIGQKFLNRIEKKLVKKALDSTHWNRRKAAVLLDISYKSLLNKIKDYNLNEAN